MFDTWNDAAENIFEAVADAAATAEQNDIQIQTGIAELAAALTGIRKEVAETRALMTAYAEWTGLPEHIIQRARRRSAVLLPGIYDLDAIREANETAAAAATSQMQQIAAMNER